MSTRFTKSPKLDKEQFINLMALEIAELYTAYPTSHDICPIELILTKYITEQEKNNNQKFLCLQTLSKNPPIKTAKTYRTKVMREAKVNH